MATELGLETELRALGQTVRVPEIDLSARVLQTLADDPVPGGRPSRLAGLRRWLRARRRSVLAVLLGGTIAVGAVSPVGAAVGRWFGFGAVVISEQPAHQRPAGPASAVVESNSHSNRLSLEQAAGLVGIAALAPSVLGPPEDIEVSDDHRRLSLLWYTDTGPMRLDEFDGTVSPYYYKKYYDDVEFVRVGSDDAAWLSGPHELVYVDAQGSEHTETARTAGPTLVWQHGGVTLRLEGVASKDDALRIAGSVG